MHTDSPVPVPAPGSAAELAAFAAIQQSLAPMYRRIFPDRRALRTVIVLPSLSLDAEVLAKVSGVHHYEERMLCMLMLLRYPRARVIYLTSMPVAPSIVEYYLHLLAGIPGDHARRRLTLLSCHDASAKPLTQKILERPRLMRRIRRAIPDLASAHLSCFNVSPLERTLAVRLEVPVYGCDPELLPLATKSGGRKLFREAGVELPDGFEDLRDEHDVAQALAALKARNPGLRRAAVKLNDGFSGEGNAVFPFEDAPQGSGLEPWVHHELPARLRFEAKKETWEHYRAKFRQMGGIVESFIDGEGKQSPSAQLRVNPVGELEMISTHDQVLGGASGQIFLGCTFPAEPDYRLEIQDAGRKVGDVLRQRGVLGRFGVDFVSVREADRWRHFAIEINLRKGGTTHPFLMLQFLTDGAYDETTGVYHTPSGQERCYYASDNLESPEHVGLTPDDLTDIAVLNGLHFNGATQEGVVFHLIGALSEFGKVGVVCVAATVERARRLYEQTVEALAREGKAEIRIEAPPGHGPP